MVDDLREFEADFYAECDELIGNIKRELANGETLSKASINNLLRFYHTLKGISAMMSFHLVENVSHSAESYLKFLYENQLNVSKKGYNLLFEAVKIIEENLEAKGNVSEDLNKRLEDIISNLKNELEHISPKKVDTKDSPEVSTSTSNSEFKTYTVSFVSTPEAREKNITVNSVREILFKLGQIISASPTITPDKQVKFVFELNTHETAEKLKEILPEGVDVDTPTSVKTTVLEEKEEGKQQSKAAKLGAGVIRVELDKIEELISQLGDLVISRSQLDEITKEFEKQYDSTLTVKLVEVNQKMERQLRIFRENIMRIRMIPISSVFDRMQFVAQDAAQTLGKTIKLVKEDNNAEIDKMLVERITDPLLHLVRNAVGHGIESPAERKKAGKSETGTITLRAFNANDKIYIHITDDGAGIDTDKLIEKAKVKGIISKTEQETKQTLLKIMFTPGFSSREKADKIGGRGVGMDIVKKTLDELGGTIDFESQKGLGTTFILTLPLTLSIMDAILVKSNEQVYAIPQSKAVEVIMIDPTDIKKHGKTLLIPYHDTAIRLFTLAALLKGDKNHAIPKKGVAIVIQNQNDLVAIGVDKIIGVKEIVVRALTDDLVKLPGIKGAAELGNGIPILIISIDELLN
ncbi:chemotaxis protein CheA [Tenuifilum thalassicum]|uniref:Chemotaxis protein CheA n=1 Tax=Tenuifilum thalassicum TaxID=2590900 RepID=A0A7D3XKY6_9BACT|nr:chemotaxis protein CheA [Tenuifilum thalassicum]QKG79955.1 chemotaxis protein CheA [Tenuifilum thalassicum]